MSDLASEGVPATGSRLRTHVLRALLTGVVEASEGAVILLGDPAALRSGAPTDLDLAVPARGRHQRAHVIRRALARLPWRSRLVQSIQHEADSHYFVVAVEVEGRWELFHPDLTTDYVRFGRRFMSYGELAEDARPFGGIDGLCVPAPRAAVRYYLAKRISKGTVTGEGIRYLRELLMADVAMVSDVSADLVGGEHSEPIRAAIAEGDAQTFRRAALRARGDLYRRHRPSAAAHVAEARRLLRRLLEPTGLSVALYGVDGSGKGTLMEALANVAGGAFWGIERWHFLRAVDPRRPERPVTDPHARGARRLPALVSKVAWYALRAWLGRAPRVFLARRRSRLVLIDRDVPDVGIDPRRYRFRSTGRLARVPASLAPRPDVALVLMADAPHVRKRSREVSEAALADLLPRYRAYAAREARAHVVDANLSPEQVAFAAADLLFARMEARILRRLGWRT